MPFERMIRIAVGLENPDDLIEDLKQAFEKFTEAMQYNNENPEIYYKLAQNEEAGLVHRAVDDILDIKCPLGKA